jgi:hypothetical protein
MNNAKASKRKRGRELYLEGIPSAELQAEMVYRAIARTDKAIAAAELSLVQMRAKQIARQKELARQKACMMANDQASLTPARR